MDKTKSIIRASRLQKYGRILSNRYTLQVDLCNIRTGRTDTTRNIEIGRQILDDEVENLLAQKATVLHEIGHVLFTKQKTWERHWSIKKEIINIVEDGRVEERMSLRYPKARLYFVYLNQKLLQFKPEKWLNDVVKGDGRGALMDFLLRVGKQKVGIPPLPKTADMLLRHKFGDDTIDFLKTQMGRALKTEDQSELLGIVQSINSIFESVFPGASLPNVSQTNKSSLNNCGNTSLKPSPQTESDKQLEEDLEEELEEQQEESNTELNEIIKADFPSESDSIVEEQEDSQNTSSNSLAPPTELTKELEDDDLEEDDLEDEDDYEMDPDTILQNAEKCPGGNDSAEENLADEEKESILDNIMEQLEAESEMEIISENAELKSNHIEKDFSSYDHKSRNPFYRNNPISFKDTEGPARRIAHLFKSLADTGDNWQHRKTRGVLEMHNLTSTFSPTSDRPRVFRKFSRDEEVDLSAVLLIDASGSMGYDAYKATKSAYIIARALELNKFKNEVGYFFGHEFYGVKSFNQTLNYAQKDFIPLASGGTPLLNALKGAEKSLSKQASKRKIIIVVTDGYPDRQYECIQKIKELERKGILVMGICMGKSARKEIFNPKHAVSSASVEQLPIQMTKVIKEVLLSIKRS